jgi:hypothetical protein
MRFRSLLVALPFAAAAVFVFPLHAADTNDLAWPEVKREHKPWTRWWWPASAVDKDNLTRELTAFAAAGLGGVEITPIYGAKGYEDRFVPFLSPKYIELLAHTSAEAGRLGLAVDMATGTGWPFGGGPQVRPEDIELKIEVKDGQLAPRPSGFKVKRSAPGGEGPVINPYSTAALTRYLERFTEALNQLPAGAIHGQFHDSFEYTANWAAEVPDKFQAMHGYDLRAHVAALGGEGEPDTVARIKADYRATLAQLHLEYVQTWAAWCRQHGWVSRNQGHGSPGNLLDLYGAADVPDTEIFGSLPFPIPGFRRDAAEIARDGHPAIVHHFASSAAHVSGRPFVSCETFTWLREHFHEAPSEMKPELDLLFLAGINHVFYHGTCYSPSDAPWPGWLFYASTQYNPRNPLWRDIGDGLNAYITRAQSLLQSGRPDNDILVYWPDDDLWHNTKGFQRQLTVHGTDWLVGTPFGDMAQQLKDRGYAFDYISDAQLEATTVDTPTHALKTSGGTTYRVIVVPKTGHMPLETLRQLLRLAEQGATVVFQDALPSDVPGFGKLADRRTQLREELARLKFAEPVGQIRVAPHGAGAVFVGRELESIFDLLHVRREPLTDAGLGFIRRKLADGHVYFVVNSTGETFDGTVELSRVEQSAALLDPRTGKAGVAEARVIANSSKTLHASTPAFKTFRTGAETGQLAVRLQLAPGESIFIRTFAGRTASGPAWRYAEPAGDAVVLGGEWRVTFQSGGPELPPAFATRELRSWTEQCGEAARFAGTARYELTFGLPAARASASGDWLLDLGDVRETARVFVNGTEIDLLWSLPYRTRIAAQHLKPGTNTLALEVTNLAANRIRDLDKRGVAWKNFYEINFVNIHYQRFDASAWPSKASGLLGPVTLTPLRAPGQSPGTLTRVRPNTE